jgi:dienelactone hydrolase
MIVAIGMDEVYRASWSRSTSFAFRICGLRFGRERSRMPAVPSPLRLRTWIALACAATSIAGVRASLRTVARRCLFPVHEVSAPAVDLHGVETWTLRASDGVPVRALFLAPPAHGPLVVAFHNNRSTAEDQLALARTLATHGLGVVVPEYRGYGAMHGYEPSQDGLFRDADAVLDHLHREGYDASRIVLLGTSLGTGVAAEMARRGHGGALVLVTPYTSIPDLVTAAVSFAPATEIVADSFDTLACAPQIHVPTLVIHGDRDEIVPFWMGRRVAESIAGARLLRIAGGRHGNLFTLAGQTLIGEIAAMARQRAHSS